MGLGGCGGSSNGPGLFVGRAPNAAVFIQWTRAGGQVTGSLDQALITTSGSTGSIDSRTVPLTGTISGSGVTLSLNNGASNLTGVLNGSELDLNYPDGNGGFTTLRMKSGTSSDFNQQVAGLRDGVDRGNQAQQQAQQAQNQAQQTQADASRVSQALAALSTDVSSAGQSSGSSSYTADLATAKKDVDQTQRDMQKVLGEAGRTDSGTLCSDAGTVQTDVGSVQSDVGTIQSDQGSTQTGTSSVASDIDHLKQAERALSGDRAGDPQDLPGGAPTAQQVNDAIRAARQVAGSATGAGGSALAQANALEQTAAGYQKRSDAACSAAGG